jgi:hypothetical protein
MIGGEGTIDCRLGQCRSLEEEVAGIGLQALLLKGENACGGVQQGIDHFEPVAG